jgi:hypothetical protein
LETAEAASLKTAAGNALPVEHDQAFKIFMTDLNEIEDATTSDLFYNWPTAALGEPTITWDAEANDAGNNAFTVAVAGCEPGEYTINVKPIHLSDNSLVPASTHINIVCDYIPEVIESSGSLAYQHVSNAEGTVAYITSEKLVDVAQWGFVEADATFPWSWAEESLGSVVATLDETPLSDVELVKTTYNLDLTALPEGTFVLSRNESVKIYTASDKSTELDHSFDISITIGTLIVLLHGICCFCTPP